MPPVVIEALKPVDTASHPDHVVGNGDPASVTQDALQKALDDGGIIVFNTGGKPATITVTRQMTLPAGAKPTVLDGMNLVSLDGGGKQAILIKGVKTELTVQRLRFAHARAEHEGAAIAVDKWFGRFTAIDCVFEDCKTTAAGPDLGGGAFRMPGQRHVQVSGCTFTDCAGSNGGAICSLGSQLTVIDCSFTDNVAFGTGGGADRGPKGQGGIGGAIYVDGVDLQADTKQLYIAGCLFRNNHAADHAGAVFGYTRPGLGSLSIYHACIFEGNSVGEPKDDGLGLAGAVYSQYCDLHVTDCTFANNRAPIMAGALFIPHETSVRIANCEFYGNRAEFGVPAGARSENVSFSQRARSPAFDALGRMPGAIAARTKADADRKRAQQGSASTTQAQKAPQTELRVIPQIDARTLAERDALLKQRAISASTTRKHPQFAVASMHAIATLEDADGASLTLSSEGTRLTLPWATLTKDDRRGLAEALARGGSEDDHALAAFFDFATGAPDKAEEQLRWSGEPGKAIRALFASDSASIGPAEPVARETVR